MSAAPALEATGLRAAYGRIPVLRGVDVSVAPGEAVGIVGHNGMGKTTLLRVLAGLLPASAGRVRLGGVDVTRRPAHRRSALGLGHVAQGGGVFANLSVRDTLRMGPAAKGGDADAALRDALRAFPALEPLLERRGGDLSGGERRLVGLAAALAAGPRALLLDEPAEGVQPSLAGAMLGLLRERKEEGLALVVVEQNLRFAGGIADRFLMLRKGEVVDGTTGSGPEALAAVEAFLGLQAPEGRGSA